MRKGKEDKKYWFFGVLLTVCAISILIYLPYKNKRTEQYMYQIEEEGRQQRKTAERNAINVVSDVEFPIIQSPYTGEPVISFEEFINGYKKVSYKAVKYNFNKRLQKPRVYQLQFKMRAQDSAAKVKVHFGLDHMYYATTEWKEYYMVSSHNEIENISWKLETDFQDIYLTDVMVTAYDDNTEVSALRNGTYLVEEFPEIMFSEGDGIGVGQAWDVTGDGDYLYSVGEGRLTVSQIIEDEKNILSTLEGLGNVRHVEVKDNNLLAVASRETGVYLIGIEDKTKPELLSYYDSLEIANDLCFAGNYMLVASRYFGVEVVDISNPENPRYVSRIVNEKECYRCTVQNKYLFISCWGTRDLEIYDISAINNPKKITTINVDGRCGEAYVEGSFLYIVSGYGDSKNAEKVGDPGYGTGNGVTIYDISNISKPVWCSTIKTEGSLQGVGYDDWSIQISNGYAYFTNSFGGLYIYDVSDSYAPKAVKRLTVPIFPDSDNFHDFSASENVAFPYDVKEYIQSPVMGVYIDNGNIYFACAYDDVHRYEFEGAIAANGMDEGEFYEVSRDKKEEKNITYSLEEFNIYSLAQYSEDIYIAGSGQGVLLMEDVHSVTDRYVTAFPVKDIKVTCEGYIITAETKGVGIYTVRGGKLKRHGYIESMANNCNVSSVAITGDGKYAITQSSWTRYEIIDLHNIENPVFVEDIVDRNGNLKKSSLLPGVGNMYYRNIVTGDLSGMVGIAGRNHTIWFESQGENLSVRNIYVNTTYKEINGSTVINDTGQVLSVYANGYVVYDPIKLSKEGLEEPEPYKIANVRLKGKAAIGGKWMAISNEPMGIIQIVDISDLTSPRIKSVYKIQNSPGIALVEEERILIPIRYGGIMEIAY